MVFLALLILGLYPRLVDHFCMTRQKLSILTLTSQIYLFIYQQLCLQHHVSRSLIPQHAYIPVMAETEAQPCH
jgi:hypothetical protein